MHRILAFACHSAGRIQLVVALRKGQRVSTPHRQFMGPQREEGVYDGDAPDHVVGPMLNDGYTERHPQGRVRYPEGGTHVWPQSAIQAL
jgi:hypothetical protein